jgi:hypothetical protein
MIDLLDKEVRVKIMDIHSVCTDGEPHHAWIFMVNGKYRATFRYESDLEGFIQWFQTTIPDKKIIFEKVYKLS